MHNIPINTAYYCVVCQKVFYYDGNNISFAEFEHYETKEVLSLDIIECSNCGSMLIAEGMNQIAWLVEDK